jgi:hypothetical protein
LTEKFLCRPLNFELHSPAAARKLFRAMRHGCATSETSMAAQFAPCFFPKRNLHHGAKPLAPLLRHENHAHGTGQRSLSLQPCSRQVPACAPSRRCHSCTKWSSAAALGADARFSKPTPPSQSSAVRAAHVGVHQKQILPQKPETARMRQTVEDNVPTLSCLPVGPVTPRLAKARIMSRQPIPRSSAASNQSKLDP